MASTSKCPYCGSTVRSDERSCPNCGAENSRFVVDEPGTVFRPKTIGELQEYCAERGMPLLRMRFFIGEDYPEPKAFGIYQDGADFIVYKNKADGSRAVRYRGPDQAYAVGELYDKLLEECHNRGIYPDGHRPVRRTSYTPPSRSAGSYPTGGASEYRGRQKSSSGNGNWLKILLFILAFLVVSGLFRSCTGGRSTIRFSSGDASGYYSDSSWDDDDDWDDWDDDDTDWDSDW